MFLRRRGCGCFHHGQKFKFRIPQTVRLGEGENSPMGKDSASTFSDSKLEAKKAMVKLFLSLLLIGSATAFAPAPSTHRASVAVNGAAMDELKIIAEKANPVIKVRLGRRRQHWRT